MLLITEKAFLFSVHTLSSIENQEQGQKFDPDGEYIRNWIPELSRMPTQWIHHPWDAPTSILIAAGVDLGSNYPKPIVKINIARERLDDALSLMWELDQASKFERFNGSGEIVADNIRMRTFDIPRVFVRKETSNITSSLDQRVPSFHNVDMICDQKRSIKLDHVAKKELEFKDLRSTAESSSTKKRSISEAKFSVPMSCYSESDSNNPQILRGSTSMQPVQKDFVIEAQVKLIFANLDFFY